MRKSLLVELFVEELPPKALKRLGEAFATGLARSLVAQGLAEADAGATTYATPRRLALHLRDVAARAKDRQVTHKLMPASVGLDAEGRPTPALLKRLLGLGAAEADAARLQRRTEGKAENLYLPMTVPGAALDEALQKALDEALAQLPIPKLMSYQLDDGWSTVHFVRPAHGLVALHGADVVRCAALGLVAGRVTRGHRFEALRESIELREADAYAEQLRAEGAVIASFGERRAELERQLAEAARQTGAAPVRDEALLDEVTALVERPNVLVGRFDEAFLEVPQECLILTMKANQKYFPLLDAAGRLTHRFLITSNVRPSDPRAVIEGNERVVRPRLADAKFFYEQDRKRRLESRVPRLARVVYHGKLGSQGERVERVRAIARSIAGALAAARLEHGSETAGLEAQVDRAALLAKADLLTDMVGEFPELQGVMGGYYARHDGESEAVAQAIEDHYRPRFAGDGLPRGEVGTVLALADKLETLLGLFQIGERPSGDKDPYALRRHAIGVIRLLVERELPLGLDALLTAAADAFGAAEESEPAVEHQRPQAVAQGAASAAPRTAGRAVSDEAKAQVAGFVFERLANALREQGYGAQEVEAVLSLRPQRLTEVERRLAAVRAFAALPEAESLAAANKRVGNILKKAEAGAAAEVVAPALFQEPAEAALAEALARVAPESDAAFERGDYTASLRSLAALKAPVDAFFDRVMVNAEDPALRANRLALLASLHRAMNRVADLSRLAA